MFILLSFLLLSGAKAGVLEPKQVSYDFKSAPEYQAIMTELKSHGEFKEKATEVVEEVKVKTMSRGEQMVEEAKARNRAILKERDAQDKAAAAVTNSSDKKAKVLAQWKRESETTLNQWKKESRDQLKAWQKEQEIFLGRLKVYKENTFEIPVKNEVIVEKKIPVEIIPEVHIVNGTFKVPIRDQYNRPTCSAFAGARGIEVLLAQHDFNYDLSEQYLYWASKPKCQTSPCSEKGSWTGSAFKHSQASANLDIPLESTCEYKTVSVDNNETQVPLMDTCKSGVTKISSYEEVKTILELVNLLKKDVPVVVAAKLSENFYKNKGLITLKDSASTGKTLDKHALGHAFLAVGIMELPEALTATEGNFCIVVANSWGKGWGAGGYSCMTEKWLETFRQPSPFLAVTKVMSK